MTDSLMQVVWKKLLSDASTEEQCKLFAFHALETLHEWQNIDPNREGIRKRFTGNFIQSENGQLAEMFIGYEPNEHEKQVWFQKTSKLAKSLYKHLLSQNHCYLDLYQAEKELDSIRIQLKVLEIVALKLAAKTRREQSSLKDSAKFRKIKRQNAKVQFFYTQLSKITRELFGNPHHEVVATVTNIVFNCDPENEVQADNIRKRTAKYFDQN